MMMVLLIVFIIFAVLFAATYFTYFERRLLAFMQLRRGPNVVGWWGILQPVADAIKSLSKEMLVPKGANKLIFVATPILLFACSFLPFMVLPFDRDIVVWDAKYGLMVIMLLSLVSFILMMLAGLYSYSNYAKFSALRVVAQFISFEIPLVAVFLCLALSADSLNLNEIVKAQEGMWFIVPHLPLFLVFIVVMLMECNRTPFDIPQAESEIVSGYQAEYSGLLFSYFMFFEYVSMLFLSFLCAVLFLGGWHGFGDFLPGWLWLWGKAFVVSVGFVWMRAVLPRLRVDQMLAFSFKVLVPLTFVWLIVTAGVKAL